MWRYVAANQNSTIMLFDTETNPLQWYAAGETDSGLRYRRAVAFLEGISWYCRHHLWHFNELPRANETIVLTRHIGSMRYNHSVIARHDGGRFVDSDGNEIAGEVAGCWCYLKDLLQADSRAVTESADRYAEGDNTIADDYCKGVEWAVTERFWRHDLGEVWDDVESVVERAGGGYATAKWSEAGERWETERGEVVTDVVRWCYIADTF